LELEQMRKGAILRESLKKKVKFREEHVGEILELLYPQLKKPLKDCVVLDAGSGWGNLTIPIAKRVKRIVAIDIREAYIDRCRELAKEEKLANVACRVSSLSDIADKAEYDFIICVDVIEHVKEQRKALKVLVRALKPNGVLYITTNNRLWPIEGHLFLPFLSYLPKGIANKYAYIFRGEGYEDYYLPTYDHLVALLKEQRLKIYFKPPKTPRNSVQSVGKRLVNFSPFFWRFANAFQVVCVKTR
jgi:ubiquinone/menaquinone biosynthesis C-methylase UbiE